MFAIIISEKGGTERREVFDKGEVNVGRVQGNDLMLPKGNVSKRHARLLLRDGRFIVTDLKSTNGTYVNGRRIAQATLVRDGDKIYVGDFMLRLEVTSGMVASEPTGASAGGSVPSAPLSPARSDGVLSHLPLENDPDEPSGAQSFPRPPPSPWVPTPPRYMAHGESTISAHTPITRSTMTPQAAEARLGVPVRSPPPSPRSPTNTLSSLAPSSGPAARSALVMVVDRVSEMLDLSPLDAAVADEAFVARIARAIREQARSLADDGEIPPSIDGEALGSDAERELLGLGVLTAWLDDDEVSEIQALRYDRIVAVRSGQAIAVEPAFSTDDTFRRAILRLCRESGRPPAQGETIVDRQLPRGVHLLALLPPTALSGHLLVLRKGRRAEEACTDDLVRRGTLSRAMGAFLTAATRARVNLLVVGPTSDGDGSLLDALASSVAAEERVIALQMADEPSALPASVIRVGMSDTVEQGAEVVRAASRIRGDRLVVDPFAGKVAVEVLDAIAAGAEGVIARVRAPALRHGLERIVPDLAASRVGLTTEAAREWLASSFAIAIEVAKLPDGRHRALRVAELAIGQGGTIATRDLFTFSVDRAAAGGNVEGSFSATGVVPRLVEELSRRGVSIDLSIFERTSA